MAKNCKEFVDGIVAEADQLKRNISGSGYSGLRRTDPGEPGNLLDHSTI